MLRAIDLSTDALDQRIVFHEADQIMEVSFEDLLLKTNLDVHLFYDRVEDRIEATGEPLWFFLINYCNSRVDPDAWFAYSRRGRDLNKGHSMGTVRFDASEITRRQIERDAGTANFNPNMFYGRDEAIDRLRSLVSRRSIKRLERPTISKPDIARRLRFYPAMDVVEVNLARLSFEHATDVDTVYDAVETQIAATARKWYFLVNYTSTRIQSPAWVRYAARGKAINRDWSLGSVRYAPGSETETDIRLRSESQGFRPNIRNTRKEALVLIEEMKLAAMAAE